MTVDVEAVSVGSDLAGKHHEADAAKGTDTANHFQSSIPKLPKSKAQLQHPGSPRSQLWKRLTQLKERIKRLHNKIHWLCIADVEILNTSCVIVEVGSFEIGALSLAVDTRRKTVDRGRLFQHIQIPNNDQRPVEWIFTVKSVLFTPEGKDSLEVLDLCSLNIHGLLYNHLEGLRDASISLKLGRVHIPYDDLIHCKTRTEECLNRSTEPATNRQEANTFVTDIMEEWDRPGSREAKLVQTVSDSKEFVSSTLRGIQEISNGSQLCRLD